MIFIHGGGWVKGDRSSMTNLAQALAARGFVTVTLAHITFTMCFVAVVVQSRLLTFDRSLEEAALDLGCRPLKAFFLITLPIIAPAVNWIPEG